MHGHVLAVLAWLNEWVRTSGFAGLMAVVAASIAYVGAARNRGSENVRARENRWWEQARWASELIASEDQGRVKLGLYALDQLVDEASDAEAGRFARAAFQVVLESAPSDVAPLDEPELGGAHLDVPDEEA